MDFLLRNGGQSSVVDAEPVCAVWLWCEDRRAAPGALAATYDLIVCPLLSGQTRGLSASIDAGLLVWPDVLGRQ